MSPQKPKIDAPTITPNIISNGSTLTALLMIFGEMSELSIAWIPRMAPIMATTRIKKPTSRKFPAANPISKASIANTPPIKGPKVGMALEIPAIKPTTRANGTPMME